MRRDDPGSSSIQIKNCAAERPVSAGPRIARWRCAPRGPGCAREADVIYAIFMLLVLLTLIAAWRRHQLELPLFAVTVLWVLIHLVGDMTTPLTLSF
jgi:hypothetical protein